jgi:HK97 gp10 family phage protein
MPSKYVLGREALRALLKKLPVAANAKLQESMTKSANDLAALQKSRVGVKSGTLRDSIRVEPFSRGGIGAIVKAGGPTTTKPVRNGRSEKYDYAMGQELGTQEMLAQPFFFPSYRQSKTKIKRNATTAVKKAIAEITK